MKQVQNLHISGCVSLAAALLFSPLGIIGWVTVIKHAVLAQWKDMAQVLPGCLFLTGMITLWLFTVHRTMCHVWMEGDVIKRRGLFGGFQKELPIHDIQDIVLYQPRKDVMCYYLIDGSSHTFDSVRTDSYICFPKNKHNTEFVQSFWQGDIQDITDTRR